MTGEAAPAGTGGGAKHIALGVNSVEFPIQEFLGVKRCENIEIKIEQIPGLVEEKYIEFSCQADRRGGEWRISRQHHDRYPLWIETYGFPKNIRDYDSANPPVIFIIRISDEYHSRFCMLSNLPDFIGSKIKSSIKNSGIEDFQPEMGVLFSLLIPPPEDNIRVYPTAPVIPATPVAPQILVEPMLPSTSQLISSVVTRYIRDSKYGKELKDLYNYQCIFCDVLIKRPHDNPYVETCHIKPLNESGPDTTSNLLILCPNHHVEFDFGAITVDPDKMTLLHIDPANPLHGKGIHLKHQINKTFLEFHYQRWKKETLMGY
jgi:hypothetical protein